MHGDLLLFGNLTSPRPFRTLWYTASKRNATVGPRRSLVISWVFATGLTERARKHYTAERKNFSPEVSPADGLAAVDSHVTAE
jgi:hypothetical protein